MRLVHLKSDCSVNPEFVSSVTVVGRCFETGNEHVSVSMENGDKFQIEPAYGMSIYQAYDKILEKLKGTSE